MHSASLTPRSPVPQPGLQPVPGSRPLPPGLLVAYCHRFDVQVQSSRVYFVACTIGKRRLGEGGVLYPFFFPSVFLFLVFYWFLLLPKSLTQR